ncbi:hypothetical protein VTN00DRAFT_864 [Thermoascus crustaceus]|uniref:uncharacterized protein n=1 Tax=Thermoascus crustaceus TaxID=5088 RepID=UPI0037441473
MYPGVSCVNDSRLTRDEIKGGIELNWKEGNFLGEKRSDELGRLESWTFLRQTGLFFFGEKAGQMAPSLSLSRSSVCLGVTLSLSLCSHKQEVRGMRRRREVNFLASPIGAIG